jgi:hypothetical protein
VRRPALFLAVPVLLAGGAFLLLSRDASGPFPSAATLQTRGFAAWPVDTVEEAEEECARPQEWRLDERATALRFALQVLRYPDPHASDWSDEQEHRARVLIGSNGTRDLFLGSLLELARFGRCWYVTGGTPREGDLGATLGFVYRGGRPNLLLGHAGGLPRGYVGFGDWETEVEAGARQSVVWMPDLERGATGHVLYAAPDEEGVSESVAIETLGHVPPPPEGPPARPLDPQTVLDDERLCRDASGFKTPEGAIRHLYRWTFDDLLAQVDGHPRYERKAFHRIGGDRWRLVVDDAVLMATIPEIAGRCYAIVSVVPSGGPDPLRRLWVDDAAVTFDVDWQGADEAGVSFGTGFGFGRTLQALDEPVTFPQSPVDGPAFAGVVLYEGGHVVSGSYTLFDDGAPP